MLESFVVRFLPNLKQHSSPYKNGVSIPTEKPTPMRPLHWGIILFALILTCLWAMFSLSAKAAECYTEAQLEKDTLAVGGKIVGAANYKGSVTDSMVIVQGLKQIIVVGFKDGCMVTLSQVEPVAAEVMKPEHGV